MKRFKVTTAFNLWRALFVTFILIGAYQLFNLGAETEIVRGSFLGIYLIGLLTTIEFEVKEK